MLALFKLHTPASLRHGEAVALDLLRHSGLWCSGWGRDECPAWWQLWRRVHFVPTPDTLSQVKNIQFLSPMQLPGWNLSLMHDVWCAVNLGSNIAAHFRSSTCVFWDGRRAILQSQSLEKQLPSFALSALICTFNREPSKPHQLLPHAILMWHTNCKVTSPKAPFDLWFWFASFFFLRLDMFLAFFDLGRFLL